MDPLQLLREYTMRSELDKVVLSDDRVDFGDRYTFPRSAVTSYKSQKGASENYRLDAVLFFMQHPDVTFGNYLRLSRQAKVEVVSGIDAKDLKNYLTGVTDTSEYIDMASVRVAEAAAADLPAEKRQKVADSGGLAALDTEAPAEQLAMEKIYAHERELRDYSTFLTMPGKDFSKVLEILKKHEREKQASRTPVKARPQEDDRRRERERTQRPPQSAPKPATVQALPIKPSGRFDRTDMQQSAMVKDINALGINPYGLHQQQPAAPAPQPAPQPGHHGRPQSGSQQHRSHQPPPSSHRSGSAHHSSSSKRGSSSGGERIPIILVPAVPSAMVNMYNVRSFLEDGVYKTTEQCKAEGVQRLPLLVINRTVDRKHPVPYHVMDKLPPKGSKDWDRVAAVFVHGPGWQFKDFPNQGAAKGDLVDVFLSMSGFFVHYHNEKVPDNVRGWKVVNCTIHRENRNNDVHLMRKVWRSLDADMVARKSKLRY